MGRYRTDILIAVVGILTGLALIFGCATAQASACTWSGQHHELPDRSCTPGDRLDVVTNRNARHTICVPGWSTRHRQVTPRRKDAVARIYGVRLPYFPRFEIDHLISLQLGGSNATINLWPLARRVKRGVRGKDSVEDALHARVCAGRMRLSTAQRVISGDWRLGRRYLGR